MVGVLILFGWCVVLGLVGCVVVGVGFGFDWCVCCFVCVVGSLGVVVVVVCVVGGWFGGSYCCFGLDVCVVVFGCYWLGVGCLWNVGCWYCVVIVGLDGWFVVVVVFLCFGVVFDGVV